MPVTAAETPTLFESFGQFVRLVRLCQPYWARLLKGMLLGSTVGVLGVVTPYLTKLLIDEVYPTEDVTLMHVLVFGILAVSVTSSFMGAIQGYYNLYVNARLTNSTTLLFFNHLQHLTVRFFDQHRVGEITSRFQDVRRALQSVNKVFETIFLHGIYLLLVPPFLLLLQWKLALVTLVSIPLTVIIITVSGRVLRKYWKRTSEAYADLNALQVEALSRIRTLKTMTLEHHIYQQAVRQIDYALQVQLRAGGINQLVNTTNGILYALNTVLFTWLGWTFIISGEMTLGSYIAFTAYIGYLYRPIREFVELLSDFQQSAVNLGRMFEYLDSPTEQDPKAAYNLPKPIQHRLRGHIELRDVSFSYAPPQHVLKSINLNIMSNTFMAIVGPSGSGKTTLLRLLVGMEQPLNGKIIFDGVDQRQINLSDLRRQMGVVWQEFSLFKGTIWDNLTMGLDEVAMPMVDQVMYLCRLDDLIKSLPKGYQTPVAEWGTSLSGGQRQRLALARALLRRTPILLLDEITSNIDVQTEKAILDNLFAAVKDKTILFVTHRVHTAVLADRICVLDKGRVVGLGSHEQLMHSCAMYRHMHQEAKLEKKK